MGLTDYGEELVMNHVWQGVTFSKPSSWYVGLFTVAPTDDTEGVEVSGNNYARRAATFGAYTDGYSRNTNSIVYPQATPAGWGTIVAVGFFEALEGGQCFLFSVIPDYVIAANGVAEFGIGDIAIAAD